MRGSSIGISGLVTLDLHSLNNEGAEGNYLQTRLVQIVGEDQQLYTVNAVSGDMMKHIQAEHLYHIALEQELSLCGPCKKFDANRIVADDDFAASFGAKALDSEVLSRALEWCVLDDLEGILITREIGGTKRSIGRKSAVEFGWLVGKPDTTRTDEYFHVKYAPEGRGKGSGERTGAENTGQNIFHRPASSGRYAAVVNLDLFRVGRNDITLEYVLPPEERLKRQKALLESVLYTFLKPSGAHRNTQNPHIVGFEGCLSVSATTQPAPLTSALNSRFIEEMSRIADVLNKRRPGSVQVIPFGSLGEFAEHMSELIDRLEV